MDGKNWNKLKDSVTSIINDHIEYAKKLYKAENYTKIIYESIEEMHKVMISYGQTDFFTGLQSYIQTCDNNIRMAAEVAEIIQKMHSKAILEIRTLFEDLHIEISPETIKDIL